MDIDPIPEASRAARAGTSVARHPGAGRTLPRIAARARSAFLLAPVAALSRATLLLVGALAAVACSPSVPGEPGVPLEILELVTLQADAQEKFVSGRWDDAVQAFRRQAEAAERSPDLAGWRDQALYNAACALARGGRPHEAAIAFAQSVEKGLRPVRIPDGRGGWSDAVAPLSLPHVLADPDLDSIRDEPAYVDVLRRYVAAETVRFDLDHAIPGAPFPVIVSLDRPGTDPWSDAARCVAPPPGFALVRCDGPIARLGPLTPGGVRDWLLADGDTRWAVAAIGLILDVCDAGRSPAVPDSAGDARGACPYDGSRVFLAGFDPESATAAVAAALEMPERVAGFIAIGSRRPLPDVADAIAAVATRRAGKPAWRVVVGSGDTELATALRAAGATVTVSSVGAAPGATSLLGE